MHEAMIPPENHLARLYEGLAEATLGLPDGEIRDDYAASGESPDEAAAAVRTLLRKTAKQYRQRELRSAAESYRRITEAMQSRWTDLPPTADERRSLLTSVLAANPQVQYAFVSLQHRDFRELSDGDVESILLQLAELGLLK